MIKHNLLSDIKLYCETNNIEDVEGLINKMLNRGFSIEKFGETPKRAEKKPKIVEKVVEVEKIVEVEKVVEVPVEKILKVSDDSKLNDILDKQNLKELEYEGKISELNGEINRLKSQRKDIQKQHNDKVKELNDIIVELRKNKDIYGE